MLQTENTFALEQFCLILSLFILNDISIFHIQTVQPPFLSWHTPLKKEIVHLLPLFGTT